MADAAVVIPVNRSEYEGYSGGDGIRIDAVTPGPRGGMVAIPAAAVPASPLMCGCMRGSRPWRRAA